MLSKRFGKGLAKAWQRPGKDLALPKLGKGLAKAWQRLGKCLATVWQSFGKGLAKPWQRLGNAWAKPGPGGWGKAGETLRWGLAKAHGLKK
jgi:hypothetical protein